MTTDEDLSKLYNTQVLTKIGEYSGQQLYSVDGGRTWFGDINRAFKARKAIEADMARRNA